MMTVLKKCKITLKPYSSLNEIRSGMPRLDVRDLLGTQYEEFYKTPSSKVPTDDILDKDIHVFYNDDFLCKGVEVFTPNNVSVIGKKLLGAPLFDLKKQFENLGYKIVMNDSGLDCEELGISLYCPDYEIEDNALVESVYVRLQETHPLTRWAHHLKYTLDDSDEA